LSCGKGFVVALEVKAEVEEEGDINRLERTILQGLMEVIVLGAEPELEVEG
jgi:hypothetical protein